MSSSGTHWDKRWFVLLAGSYMLHYYKSDAAHREGAEPLGALDVRESYLSIKEEKGSIKHCTLYTSARKLKLRAFKKEDYAYWRDALQRFAGDADQLAVASPLSTPRTPRTPRSEAPQTKRTRRSRSEPPGRKSEVDLNEADEEVALD